MYGANNEDLSPVPSASNTKVVALKMYDPQLHDHLTTPGKAALSRWEPLNNWLCLLGSLGQDIWAFDAGDMDKKSEAVRRAVDVIRQFIEG